MVSLPLSATLQTGLNETNENAYERIFQRQALRETHIYKRENESDVLCASRKKKQGGCMAMRSEEKVTQSHK